MRRRGQKAYLCVWCEERRRGTVLSCVDDLERHTTQVHGRGVPEGAASVEVRYRPVRIQGRT